MKTVAAIVLLAFFSTAQGTNDTDLVYKFVDCALWATENGIEGLIPVHNPLKIRDIVFNSSLLGNDLYLEITDNYLFHLMDLELKEVNVTSYTSPNGLNIDYDIYWPVLNFTGNYEYSLELFSGSGSYNVVLYHTDFFGIFNLTKSGQEDQGIKSEVKNFTLGVSVVETEVSIPEVDILTNALIERAIHFLMNHVPGEVGEFLRTKRFNEFWIDHPERISEVTDWCANNPRPSS
ncbi:uncharacterized protein [Euwallacea fornicatus]|uniref:uncharacterized protein n=1 Tax=Euwallacea fornicatus TaxID=995702 RepID=UPI0033903515